jgi:DNA-binding CsgD family transcriptional regulator
MVIMMAAGGLSECDLRRLIAVVEDGRRDEPTAGVPWAVLDGLAALIECDELSWVELDLTRSHRPIQQDRAEDGSRVLDIDLDEPLDEAYWKHYRAFRPCSAAAPCGHSALRWSEFYTLRELRNTALHTEYFANFGTTDCLFAGLPTAAGHTRRVLCWREGGVPFSDRDSLVLELLRPHLAELHRDAQLRRSGIPQLTRREWEVLRLAADGNSNAEIARLLFISTGTVRKHLEHIFDRTGVHSRGAAVALMMPRLQSPWGQQDDGD